MYTMTVASRHTKLSTGDVLNPAKHSCYNHNSNVICDSTIFSFGSVGGGGGGEDPLGLFDMRYFWILQDSLRFL